MIQLKVDYIFFFFLKVLICKDGLSRLVIKTRFLPIWTTTAAAPAATTTWTTTATAHCSTTSCYTHTPSSKCVSKTVPPKACGILMAKSAQTFGFGWTKLNENFAWNERFTCLKEKNSLQTTLCSSSKMHLKDASLE